ncbi:substrate-binding periplasmic protein [Pseudomonas citronellolis]|uniref:substrate-binding periplasmic protein n=1 Tax=Pseudomonas citronellolis TaxID=53408 RepID=UPI0023E404A1|nr:transporter substrate-binding domain-containing protein [Pseudomonas citronellolis]MDF3935583.1 transporter substrate-binding domain-containing protein [Pseudomonas citronellolis]
MSAACEKTLRWDDDPPFSMQLADGAVGGIYVELNRLALERLGCQVRLVKLPWARALKELENGRLDVLPGAFRKPERELYAYFSGAILQPSRNILFMRRGDPARASLHDLLDLLGTSFRLGAQMGVSYGQSYQELLGDDEFASRMYFNPSRINLWHMIDKDRLDGIIADENSGLYELRQLGLSERIGPTAVVVSSDAAETAFSKLNNSPAFVERYADTVRGMVQSGEYQAILARYLGR